MQVIAPFAERTPLLVALTLGYARCSNVLYARIITVGLYSDCSMGTSAKFQVDAYDCRPSRYLVDLKCRQTSTTSVSQWATSLTRAGNVFTTTTLFHLPTHCSTESVFNLVDISSSLICARLALPTSALHW